MTIALDQSGRTFWLLGIHDAGKPTQILLRDDQLVLRKGDLFPSVGMPLVGIQAVIPNGADQVLFAGTFGFVPDATHQALLVLDLAADGSIASDTLIVQLGDTMPGQPGTVAGVSAGLCLFGEPSEKSIKPLWPTYATRCAAPPAWRSTTFEPLRI